eukprot:5745778-Alexandrium_andersonii.AAC.1
MTHRPVHAAACGTHGRPARTIHSGAEPTASLARRSGPAARFRVAAFTIHHQAARPAQVGQGYRASIANCRPVHGAHRAEWRR